MIREAKSTERSGRAPAGSVASVSLVAAALTLILAAQLFRLQSDGRSAAAIAMAADMDMRDMGRFWSFPILQASGLVALAFAYVTAVLGLVDGIGKASGRALPKLECLHRRTSWAVVVLLAVHIVATTLDAMGDSWRTVLIPGTWASQGWPAAVTGYNTGIVATYLLVLLGPTYYARRLVSVRIWRLVHRGVVAFYALSVWHAMILGLDLAYYTWLRPLVWSLQIPLVVLLMIRLYRAAWPPLVRTRSSATRTVQVASVIAFALCGLAAVAILVIVVTGHSGFIATV